MKTNKQELNGLPQAPGPAPHAPCSTPRAPSWYAFYTSPRAEKKVECRLREAGYEVYLPLVRTMVRWSDRKKMVEKPLISSYIFVSTMEHELRAINCVEGVSRYISFEGKPAVVTQQEIDNLRLLVDSEAEVELRCEKMVPGDPVEVTHGSLQGLTGELVKTGTRNRMVVRIDRLNLNLVVKIQRAFLAKRRQK